MKHAMLDLETMSTSPNAAIVQIGACYFDVYGIKETFCVNVNLHSEAAFGFDIEADTIMWWLSQSKEAQDSIRQTPMESSIALIDTSVFLRRADWIWSHSTFDFVILMNHYRKLKIAPSFHFRNSMDIRTLVNLTVDKSRAIREGIHHNALDDSIYQAGYVTNCLKEIGKW